MWLSFSLNIGIPGGNEYSHILGERTRCKYMTYLVGDLHWRWLLFAVIRYVDYADIPCLWTGLILIIFSAQQEKERFFLSMIDLSGFVQRKIKQRQDNVMNK